MTNDEIEIILASTIHEIDRLSSSIENIHEILGDVLEKRAVFGRPGTSKSSLNRASVRRPISRIFEAGKTIRRRLKRNKPHRRLRYFGLRGEKVGI